MANFEWELVNALNTFFERNSINAIAYRLKQSRFSAQLVDILVDSKHPEYYLAIECKSLDARKTKSLYFKQHFSLGAGAHQMSRETDFITRSGRQGILAVELRYGIGKSKEAYLIPWGQIFHKYNSGKVGITLQEIVTRPPLERKSGTYEISRLDIVNISGYYDMAMDDDPFESDLPTED